MEQVMKSANLILMSGEADVVSVIDLPLVAHYGKEVVLVRRRGTRIPGPMYTSTVALHTAWYSYSRDMLCRLPGLLLRLEREGRELGHVQARREPDARFDLARARLVRGGVFKPLSRGEAQLTCCTGIALP